jgi:hypothetical protein
VADLADASIASWVQAGGVVAFAGAVLWELKQLRPIMGEVKSILSSLLERERMRAEQRAQIIARQQAVPHQVWDDVTDAITEPVPKVRRKTPARPFGGYGPSRPSTNHDDE